MNSERPLSIAVIGCGAIADSLYLPALANEPRGSVHIVLVDSNQDRLRIMADRYHVGDYVTDYRSLIGKVDAAIVSVPHHLHHNISADFLSADIHVLCEKPLAENALEAADMVRLAGEHGVILSVNNTRRLYPSSAQVKRWIASGEIGTPRSILFVDGGEFNWPTASGFYFNSRISSKGVVLDVGAHVLDLICWWLDGKPAIVSSKNDSFGGCEAAAAIVMSHHSCEVNVKLSRLAKLQNRFLVTGDEGVIEGEVYNWRNIRIRRTNGRGQELHFTSSEDELRGSGRVIVRNFINAIRGNEAPFILAQEVLPSIELLDEAYAKAERFAMPWYDNPEVLHAA